MVWYEGIMKVENNSLFCEISAKKRSTLKAGGLLDCVACPSSMADLQEISQIINDESIECIIVGKMSNILVLDGGYKGLVVCTNKLRGIDIKGNNIYCGSGERLSKIIQLAIENEFSGVERLCGIPGTVGGAIFMNSGCFDAEISNIIKKVYLFDMDKQKSIEKTVQEMMFRYRGCGLNNKNQIIVGACLKLEEKNYYDIKSVMQAISGLRRNSQPQLPSLGSVFKRVGNTSAGIFVEGSGLKGYGIGDMEISKKHANFIVNKGEGKADDFLELVELAEKRVFEKYGISLEREVTVVGERT